MFGGIQGNIRSVDLFSNNVRRLSPARVVGRQMNGGAVERGVATQCIDMTLARHVVDARSGLPARDRKTAPRAMVSPTVGQADDTRHHRVADFDDWFRKFQAGVTAFAKQTLSDFVLSAPELQPITPGRKLERRIPEKIEA